MSFVGPRPELPEYVQISDELWQRVLEVRPGLTDPVTIRLRNEEELLTEADTDPETFYRQVLQRYKLLGYLEYLTNRSATKDLLVLVKTLGAVIFPRTTKPPSLKEMSSRLLEYEDGKEPGT
jgi:lipopolysaccharide/colanic/teichoic acid biosynthesis glycosyltransferase